MICTPTHITTHPHVLLHTHMHYYTPTYITTHPHVLLHTHIHYCVQYPGKGRDYTPLYVTCCALIPDNGKYHTHTRTKTDIYGCAQNPYKGSTKHLQTFQLRSIYRKKKYHMHIDISSCAQCPDEGSVTHIQTFLAIINVLEKYTHTGISRCAQCPDKGSITHIQAFQMCSVSRQREY